jgi:hypothetical protein
MALNRQNCPPPLFNTNGGGVAHPSPDVLGKSTRTWLQELQQSVEAMRRNMELIAEVLAANPSIQQVAAALQRKQRAQVAAGGRQKA